MKSGRRSPEVISHICPIGLRCACVPIRFDDRLVGVAKLVVDGETHDAAFSAATDVLRLVVSRTSEQFLASLLSEQVRALRQCMAELQQVRSKCEPPASDSDRSAGAPEPDESGIEYRTVVERALAYLQQHYPEPNLSLRAIARILECNPRYLTTRFTQIVGEPMHRYLVGLRVAHACRILMGTNLPIKETSYASGFLRPASLARAFQRYVGVSPREYRRIFAAR